MSNNSSTETPQWVYNRILGFFNQARNVSDLLDGTIKDDPSDGPGNTLGETVAARILRRRNELPRRRFTDFEQIDAVVGVGPNTVQDFIYSFGTTADAAFVNSMYNGTIYPNNWPLEYFRTEIADKNQFDQLMQDKEALRDWIRGKLVDICEDKGVSKQDCKDMTDQVKNAYIDQYSNFTPAAGYALALWFYEFDADNWFSWEKIQEETIGYFDYHMRSFPWYMQLHFVKGFQQKGILQPGITPPDLPVVINEPEQSITLWFSTLYD